jgi:hypothetical protein
MSMHYVATRPADGPIQGGPAASPAAPVDRDREIARAVMAAVRHLNDLMDDAIKAGLVVEPSFSLAQNRFEDLGISTPSYVASVKMFRKLC